MIQSRNFSVNIIWNQSNFGHLIFIVNLLVNLLAAQRLNFMPSSEMSQPLVLINCNFKCKNFSLQSVYVLN